MRHSRFSRPEILLLDTLRIGGCPFFGKAPAQVPGRTLRYGKSVAGFDMEALDF